MFVSLLKRHFVRFLCLLYLYVYVQFAMCILKNCIQREKIETKNVNHSSSMEKLRRMEQNSVNKREFQVFLQYDRVRSFFLNHEP